MMQACGHKRSAVRENELVVSDAWIYGIWKRQHKFL